MPFTHWVEEIVSYWRVMIVRASMWYVLVPAFETARLSSDDGI